MLRALLLPCTYLFGVRTLDALLRLVVTAVAGEGLRKADLCAWGVRCHSGVALEG